MEQTTDAKRTPSLNNSQYLNDTKYLQPLLMKSEKVDFAQKLLNQSNKNQLEPPWIMWHRPLSWLTSPTPDWTVMGDLHSFYNDNSSSTQTMTNQFNNRQQSPDLYSENSTKCQNL